MDTFFSPTGWTLKMCEGLFPALTYCHISMFNFFSISLPIDSNDRENMFVNSWTWVFPPILGGMMQKQGLAEAVPTILPFICPYYATWLSPFAHSWNIPCRASMKAKCFILGQERIPQWSTLFISRVPSQGTLDSFQFYPSISQSKPL